MEERSELGSRYFLEEPIGRGPSGTVYRAMDIDRGEHVALKVIQEAYGEDPRLAVRFRQHMRLVANLTHAGLVVPKDYGYLDNRYYIASELVDGVDLGTYMAAHGPLPSAEAAAIAAQICTALEEVHRRGLIHRGIKPTNILLIKDGLVKVTDIGLGAVISETGLSKTKLLLGDVNYLSPEQARGEQVGPESDLYSLGVMLFQMLTNRLPFESNSAWSIVRLHGIESPPWPREFNHAVPLELEGVVMRALQKTPDSRYSTASEMETALSAASRASATWNRSLHKFARVAGAGLRSRANGWETGTPGLISDRRLVMPGPLGRPVILGAGLALQFLTSFLIAFAALYALSGLVLRDGLGALELAHVLNRPRDAGAPMAIQETTMTAPRSKLTPGPEISERSPVGESLAILSEPTSSAGVFDGQTLALELVQADQHRQQSNGEDRDDEEEEKPGAWEIDFSGVVESMNGDYWRIGGRIVVVSSKTEIEGDVQVGDYVEVEALRRSGAAPMALEIEVEEPDWEDDD